MDVFHSVDIKYMVFMYYMSHIYILINAHFSAHT